MANCGQVSFRHGSEWIGRELSKQYLPGGRILLRLHLNCGVTDSSLAKETWNNDTYRLDPIFSAISVVLEAGLVIHTGGTQLPGLIIVSILIDTRLRKRTTGCKDSFGDLVLWLTSHSEEHAKSYTFAAWNCKTSMLYHNQYQELWNTTKTKNCQI
ncbi:hypothetical protein CW304_01495 [Bacillus sp. UFRGS-B20]|nr:hypothetical protein CW304_01495 [Bacillus sp. UFRGS-B20]